MFSARDGLKASGFAASAGPWTAQKFQARRVRKVSSASRRSGYAADSCAPWSVNTRPVASWRAATSWSTSKAPPRSTDQATRRPRSEAASGAAKVAPGSPRAWGARASGPAITDSSSATSPTFRAIGPVTPIVSQWLRAGQSGTRPNEGRRPTTPQNDAGLRNEPPMSEPSASGTMPAARAAAAPPLDPPADRLRSAGLRVVPKIVLKVCDPAANSGTFVLPSSTTPAPRIRSTARVSASGTKSAWSGEPNVVRQPATGCVSFTANGRPCSGPTGSPAASALVGCCRGGTRPLGIEGDDGVDLAVALLDPGQVQVQQLAGGDLALANRPRHLAGGRLDREVVAGHLRRPPRATPAATPSSTSPAPTATPFMKSGLTDAWPAAGAVKTCPSPDVRAETPTWGPSRAGLGARQDGVDVAEELAGHPAGHAGEHPLADPTDHAADDGVGFVGDSRGAVAGVAEVDLHLGADGARGTGPLELHHQRLVRLEVGEDTGSGVGAPDRGDPGRDGHGVGVLAGRLESLAARDRADQDCGVEQGVPHLVDGCVQDGFAGELHEVSSRCLS